MKGQEEDILEKFHFDNRFPRNFRNHNHGHIHILKLKSSEHHLYADNLSVVEMFEANESESALFVQEKLRCFTEVLEEIFEVGFLHVVGQIADEQAAPAQELLRLLCLLSLGLLHQLDEEMN